MSRAKKGAKKANGGKKVTNTPKNGANGPPSRTPPAKTGEAAFSLRDAARSSEHRSIFWESTTRLRHQGISFVSGGTTGSTLHDISTQKFGEVEQRDEAGNVEMDISEGDGPPPQEPDLQNLGFFDPPLQTAPSRQDRATSRMREQMNDMHLNSTRSSRPQSQHATPPHVEVSSGAPRNPSPIARQTLSKPTSRVSSRRPSPPLQSRPSSPTPSNSSEDVVIFKGRNPSRPPPQQAPQRPSARRLTPEPRGGAGNHTVTVKSTSREHSVHIRHETSRTRNLDTGLQQTTHVDTVKERRVVSDTNITTTTTASKGKAKVVDNGIEPDEGDLDAEDAIETLLKNDKHTGPAPEKPPQEYPQSGRRGRKRRGRRRGRAAHSIEVFDDGDDIPEDVLEDYLENLKANGEIVEDSWEDEPDSQPNQGAGPAGDSGWGRTELEDFGNLSTSEEVREIVSHVLSRRERPSGLQYLVVWEGHSVDEARWIHHEKLVERHGAHVHITKFEEVRQQQLWEEAQAAEIAASSSDPQIDKTHKVDKVIIGPGSSSEEEENEYDPDNDSQGIDESGVEDDDYDTDDLPMSDEEDLIRRRKERMTDEHIARLLQRQEELGMDGDELMLFDGIEDELDEEDIDPYVDNFFQHGHSAPTSRDRRAKRRAMSKQTMTQIHGAQEDALSGDDYGAFDIMDYNRASLQKKRTTELQQEIDALGIDDSDLERKIAAAWGADKQKKKLKKIEREELRAEGLLGGASGKKTKSFSSTKRGDALSLNEFEDELEEFLESEKRQLALPPMDKKLRKLIHEIANKFGLKSKSSGGGNNRFPVLYKSARTKRFDAATFDMLAERLSRRFGVLGGGSRRGKVPKPFVAKTGHGIADGQRVGAGAREIGIENKGRAMLEKMGWSKGNALGAMDNKGILVPIDSVMKKTRAGLG